MAKKVLIVVARFYGDLADELVKGAVAVLEENGLKYDVIDVPGAFEIPAAVNFAIDRYDGFVALGCVIRGQTSHYDYVCSESARGLQQLAIDKKAAIGYGILTVENKDQAWARASVDKKNKGADAANTCIAMMELRKRFKNK